MLSRRSRDPVSFTASDLDGQQFAGAKQTFQAQTDDEEFVYLGMTIFVDGARTDYSVTRVLAIDCEMDGVGRRGKISALAKVSIVGIIPETVNMWGNIAYDRYVRPVEQVTDFRTRWSGIRPCNLTKGDVWSTGKDEPLGAEDLSTVQKEVSKILKNRVLVGHALHNDLKVLLLTHPQKDIRDTQNYGPLRIEAEKGHSPALKDLADFHLGIRIQQGEHDSLEDARTALRLYLVFEDGWEKTAREFSVARPVIQRWNAYKSVGGNKRRRKSNVGSKQPAEGTRVGRKKCQKPCYSTKTSRDR